MVERSMSSSIAPIPNNPKRHRHQSLRSHGNVSPTFDAPALTNTTLQRKRPLELITATFVDFLAHTGLEPVVSALRGQRVSRLHQCALVEPNYRSPGARYAGSAS